jgi:hypothetical protein
VGAAVAVARRHGLAVTDPRVVRDLSNVLVHLAPAPVVALAHELPAGPHHEDGFALSFWRLVAAEAERPTAARAGRELRELHERLDGFPGVLAPLCSVLDEVHALVDRLD